jgi:tetratricopeptide (TPR) repeat protein
MKYKKALNIDPDFAEVHCNLGVVLSKQGRFDEAIMHYNKALASKPNWYEAQTNLDITKKQKEKFEKTLASWLSSLEKNPNQPDLHNRLGVAFYQQDNLENAVYHWSRALQLKPDWPSVLNSLAWIKTNHPNTSFYNPNEAVQLALRGCELTKYKEPIILNTLSTAYATVGKFPDAVRAAEKALQITQATGNEQLAVTIEKKLEFYKQNQLPKANITN